MTNKLTLTEIILWVKLTDTRPIYYLQLQISNYLGHGSEECMAVLFLGKHSAHLSKIQIKDLENICNLYGLISDRIFQITLQKDLLTLKVAK